MAAIDDGGTMRGRMRLGLRLLLCMVVAALAVGLGACDDDGAGPERGVSIEDVIAADGERLAGDTVTVSGRVEEVLDARGFYLRGSEGVLLVVGAASAGGPRATEGAVVEVTGKVRRVAAARGELPLDPRGFVDYASPTFLAADAIRPLSG